MSIIDINTALLNFSDVDPWTVKDSFEGVQIFGGTGSGKTSGSGAAIARAMLDNAYGGLVLTVKKDECRQWQEWAAATGRSESVFIMKPDSEFIFNFMDYESSRGDESDTEMVVNLFMSVIEIANSGKIAGKEAYWVLALRQMLRNAVDVLKCAKNSISIFDMYRLILSAPQSNIDVKSKDFKTESFCFEMMQKAALNESENPYPDLEISLLYWMKEFPNIAEKTRSIIVSMFTTTADAFLRGNLKKLFDGKTNLPPEYSQEGAIIILDLPVKEYGITGRIAQSIYKLVWQQAMERRDIDENTRPVFLFADEAQNFISGYDVEYQQTARSSRIASVYLSQNISNYHVALSSPDHANSILGNLSTKIFHSNSDVKTNNWASEIFGKTMQDITGFGQNRDAEAGTSSTSVNVNKQLQYLVEPLEFTTLSNGGLSNNLLVESIVHQSGRIWNITGSNHMRATFKQ